MILKKYVQASASIILATVFAGALFSSCKKMIEIDPPIGKLEKELIFSNDKTAEAAVAGIYNQIMYTSSYASLYTTVFAGFSANEFKYYNSSFDEFSTNNIVPSDSWVLGIWSIAYQHIYYANTCIEGLTIANGVSELKRKQLLGEAKFFRAFSYFYLTNFFGDVPLITSTAFESNSFLPRDPQDKIYDQIITDLKEAKDLLPENYVNNEKVRVNKWSAAALLARAYLYKKDYVNAETEAGAVLSSNKYSLVQNLNNVFLKNSSEAILQFMPVIVGENSKEGAAFVPSTTATANVEYQLTPDLLNAFETNDARKTAWVGSKSVLGILYYFPNKYKLKNNVSGVIAQATEYNMILRLAEQYLIRAEARVQQNKITESLSDLNVIRMRAALPPSSATNKSSILLAIEQERRIEFFAEWGHRWFDLKRTGRANDVLGSIMPNWTPNHVLYPIPENQLLANPKLTQNPGY